MGYMAVMYGAGGRRCIPLGPVFAFVLRLRGAVTFHASAVRIGDAVAFLGPQGAGKSTTAAALALRGCPY